MSQRLADDGCPDEGRAPDEGLGVRTEIDVFLADDGPKVFSRIQTEIVRI